MKTVISSIIIVLHPAKMSAADKYQALGEKEHVLLRTGVYIGSIENDMTDMFISNNDSLMITKKKINYNAGLTRIFEEILLNAFDHTIRDASCTEIRVNVDRESNSITVFNNGSGIPIVIKKELGIYVPEMLFGMLRSGSNFDETQQRITGGQNGLGATLAVIFSKKFILQTVDADTKKMYTQTWENNMDIKSKPIIKTCKKKPYTLISFEPDLERFGLTELSEDFELLIKKRLIDIGFASAPNIRTYYNNEEITIKKPEDYIKLYEHPLGEKPIIDITDRWTVGVIFSENGFQHASFVNGIHTNIGGTHVDSVVNQITKEIITKLATKKITVKPSDVKNKIFVFVKAIIEKPGFNSQTKECLTTPKSKYGSEYIMSETFKKKLLKSNILTAMTAISDNKQFKELEKTNGAKTVRICDIEELEDANWAARKKNLETRLILCEGKSAKTFAMGALKVLGRDRFGIFPLRGKLLNVRDTALSKVSANNEIKNIMKIVGLKYGVTYEDDKDVNELRYGGVIALTDSDADGAHISGLIINYFHNFWPALINRGFISCCITPIVKVFQGKEIIPFYTLHDYEEWIKSAKGKYKSKYFKGLGTSTREDACDALSNIDNKLIAFQRDEQCDEHISLAFNSKRADDRKEWLLHRYDPASCIDRNQRECNVTDFINHELIHFSTYDCERSIPNIMDGLKVSQRKIMYIAIKYIAKDEMKVGQLAPKVAEQTDYHHGETSLCGAVIGMAQDYVGSNNINLLEPHGGFGSRLSGGKDAASPRYIFTQLNPVSLKLFDQRDNCLLTHKENDGMRIEPCYYYPVLPMILINGALGIGTGFSSSVLKHKPQDVAIYIKNLLTGKKTKQLLPWYRGFNGIIEKNDDCKYTTYAVWEFIDKERTLRITELPINVWTDDYKIFCEGMLSNKETPLQDIIYDYDDITIDIKIIFKKNQYERFKSMKREELIKIFKLSSKLSETNMYLFNADAKLQYFKTVDDIIKYYYDIRLDMYIKRKEAMIEQLRYEMLILNNKAKFIKFVKDGKINMRTMSDESLLKSLKKDFEADPRATGADFELYNYLIVMNYRSFTNENMQRMNDLVKSKQKEIDDLEKLTPEQMWITDIDSIIDTLNKQETTVKPKVKSTRKVSKKQK